MQETNDGSSRETSVVCAHEEDKATSLLMRRSIKSSRMARKGWRRLKRASMSPSATRRTCTFLRGSQSRINQGQTRQSHQTACGSSARPPGRCFMVPVGWKCHHSSLKGDHPPYWRDCLERSDRPSFKICAVNKHSTSRL